MYRARRYAGEDKTQDTTGYVYPRPVKSVIKYMKNYNNRSVTENGAVGLRTTTRPLLDLNFKVSSLRDRSEEEIVQEFVKAYYDDSKYAVKWLFFLRDILQGMGERRTFRVCMKYMAQSHPEVAKAVMKLIPQYGRWDDMLVFLDTPLCDEVVAFVKEQLLEDFRNMEQYKPVSLMAKWLPSANASSKETRRLGRLLAKKLDMTEAEYRKYLSTLREWIGVLEVKLSANLWDQVDYEHVPAKANLKYETAFEKHDQKRRIDYLYQVATGDAKLNGNGIMPYEVVHRYMKGNYCSCLKENLLAELMWENLLKNGFKNDWGLDDCMVVADGSGSMYSNASGSTSVTAIEICNSLAIYFAQQLKGVFHNKAITFSERPQFIDLEPGEKLKDKLEIMLAHNEVANTNIEAVFDMLLDMAVSNQVDPEELPKQLLIISDMEFDTATGQAGWRITDREELKFTDTLFETIEKRYEAAGYKIPRLIFWNVCGRTDTIPMVDNEEGICLLSGFSQNAMKVAAHKEIKDPYESLLKTLDGPRYAPVEEALGTVAA